MTEYILEYMWMGMFMSMYDGVYLGVCMDEDDHEYDSIFMNMYD